MSQRRIYAYISSANAVLPEAQPMDKTVSKEDILGALSSAVTWSI